MATFNPQTKQALRDYIRLRRAIYVANLEMNDIQADLARWNAAHAMHVMNAAIVDASIAYANATGLPVEPTDASAVRVSLTESYDTGRDLESRLAVANLHLQLVQDYLQNPKAWAELNPEPAPDPVPVPVPASDLDRKRKRDDGGDGNDTAQPSAKRVADADVAGAEPAPKRVTRDRVLYDKKRRGLESLERIMRNMIKGSGTSAELMEKSAEVYQAHNNWLDSKRKEIDADILKMETRLGLASVRAKPETMRARIAELVKERKTLPIFEQALYDHLFGSTEFLTWFNAQSTVEETAPVYHNIARIIGIEKLVASPGGKSNKDETPSVYINGAFTYQINNHLRAMRALELRNASTAGRTSQQAGAEHAVKAGAYSFVIDALAAAAPLPLLRAYYAWLSDWILNNTKDNADALVRLMKNVNNQIDLYVLENSGQFADRYAPAVRELERASLEQVVGLVSMTPDAADSAAAGAAASADAENMDLDAYE